MPFQLAGNIKHGGLVEKAFGLTLREAIFGFGGGTATDRPFCAVQVGGPRRTPEAMLDTSLDYGALDLEGLARPRRRAASTTRWILPSRGGAPPWKCRGELRQVQRRAASVPHPGVEVIDKIIAGTDRPGNRRLWPR